MNFLRVSLERIQDLAGIAIVYLYRLVVTASEEVRWVVGREGKRGNTSGRGSVKGRNSGLGRVGFDLGGGGVGRRWFRLLFTDGRQAMKSGL